MTSEDNEVPQIVENVNDMGWFQSVLDASRETLKTTPEDSKPSWYRQYEAQAASGL